MARPGVQLILLPGILMPAALRYQPLLAELEGVRSRSARGVRAIPKELEVYAGPEPPQDYSIDTEVMGVSRAADAAGFDQFHLYGHSAGGAIALAYAASHPERVLSLAVDEPAFDFTVEEKQSPRRQELERLVRLPPDERMPAFLRFQLRPGVEPPAQPPGPPPPWMAQRPAGLEAFLAAAATYSISNSQLRALHMPVYYSYGDLSSPEWEERRDRLSRLIPNFAVELYRGCSHLRTSHQVDPGRVATALRQLWDQADLGPS